jgi:hypothetical protein
MTTNIFAWVLKGHIRNIKGTRFGHEFFSWAIGVTKRLKVEGPIYNGHQRHQKLHRGYCKH